MHLSFKKKIIFYILGFALCLLTLLTALIISEAAYRFFYKNGQFQVVYSDVGADSFYAQTPTGWRLRPNVKGIIKKHPMNGKRIEINSNSLGYRNYELGNKTPDQFRILVLGDSVTLADYADDQDTYVRQLETSLRTHSASQKTIQAINAGVGGIDLANKFYILKETGLSVKPDIVVLAMSLNDSVGSVVIRPILPYPLNRLKILHFFYEKYIKVKERFFSSKQLLVDKAGAKEEFLKTNETADGDWKNNTKAFNKLIVDSWPHWGIAYSAKSWTQIEEILKQMQSMAEDHKFKLVVALFPVSYQVESKTLSNTPQKFMKDLADKYHLDYLDLLPAFRDKFKNLSDIKDLFYDHCHLTTQGNALVAKELELFLMQKNLIQKN